MIVRAPLHLDQIGHRSYFGDAPETFADSLLTVEGNRHLCPSLRAAHHHPGGAAQILSRRHAATGGRERRPHRAAGGAWSQQTPKTGRASTLVPRSTISIFSAAPTGRRCALSKVVADLPYFDSRTRIFKLLLDFCCLFFVDPLLDRLWGRLDEILRLLEAKARDRTYFLDDVDLFV